MPKSKYGIEVLKTEKSKTKQPECAEKGILCKYPSSYIVIGKSGSGKTNTVLNMLKNEKFYGGFFDYIVYFSPTGEIDDLITKTLGLPKNNIKTDFTEADVTKIIDAQKKLIDSKGIKWVFKNSKVMLVFDDIISNRKFVRSKTMVNLFSLLRHYGISVMILSQYYKRLCPVSRVNATGIILFPSSQTEIDKFVDEQSPANMNKKEFQEIIKHATKERYNFLFINNHADPAKKLRKNFDTILNIGN